MRKFVSGAIVALMVAVPASAQEVDLDMMYKIRNEGMNNSKVMETLTDLTDNVGARLTKSPGKRKGEQWAMKRMKDLGMTNVHLEGFEFGVGWDAQSTTVTMTAPRMVQLAAVPMAWYPGTDGDIEGEVIHVSIRSMADAEKYKGKLAGKIVALSPKADITVWTTETGKSIFQRHDHDSLEEAAKLRIPTGNRRGNFTPEMRRTFTKRTVDIANFLKEEGAIGTVSVSRTSGGIMRAFGGSARPGNISPLPQVALGQENYNRMLRYLEDGETVRLKMNVDATFYDDDLTENNVIGEIKGKGRKPEIVMAGAHLDSWHLGDGAVDNGAGVAVILEAMRILKAVGVEPKRTIRVGFWGGEEQGLHGSREYVAKHFQDYPSIPAIENDPLTPGQRKDTNGDKIVKDDYEKFSVYFNFDNGSGRIRGINTHGNLAASEVFKDWFAPLEDLETGTVAPNGSGGSDHVAFQSVGLPGYQFIVDRLDYFSRTWHTQLDTIDNAHEKDLKQAAVIMAAFIYNASMADERFPRRPSTD